jgi:hypothetical protein
MTEEPARSGRDPDSPSVTPACGSPRRLVVRLTLVPRLRGRLAGPRPALIASPAEPKPGQAAQAPAHAGIPTQVEDQDPPLDARRAAPLPHELDIGERRGTCASSEPLLRRENQPTCRPFTTIEVEASPPDRPERPTCWLAVVE